MKTKIKMKSMETWEDAQGMPEVQEEPQKSAGSGSLGLYLTLIVQTSETLTRRTRGVSKKSLALSIHHEILTVSARVPLLEASLLDIGVIIIWSSDRLLSLVNLAYQPSG